MSTEKNKEVKAEVKAPVEKKEYKGAKPVPRGTPVTGPKLTVQEKAKAAEIAQAQEAEAKKREAAMKSRRAREAAERRNIARMRKAKLGADRKVGTNPLALPWPQDAAGKLTALKKGGLTAARRVNGDKAALVKLLKTLEILADHAKARYVMDVEARGKAKENHLSARVRNTTARAEAAERKAVEYEKAAKRTRNNAGI